MDSQLHFAPKIMLKCLKLAKIECVEVLKLLVKNCEVRVCQIKQEDIRKPDTSMATRKSKRVRKPRNTLDL